VRVLGTVAVLLALAAIPAAGAAPPAPAPMFRALVFTKTAGYRHDSIPAAIAAVEKLGAQNGFAVDQTEDAGAFTDANLDRYRVVVFLLTTGDVLDDDQQAALQRFVEAGNGWVGVHSAADTEYDWPAVHVLLTIDESTYDANGASMGTDHPLAWRHDYDGGRAWYTALGHTTESYAEPLFLGHLLGGIEWAAGMPTAPRLTKVTTRLNGRRVAVTATHPACACDATVRVHGATIRAPALTSTTSLTTPGLPRGRWTVVLTLSSRTLVASVSARRRVTVR
jgi:cytochrome c